MQDQERSASTGAASSPAGRRRLDHVVDPAFVADLGIVDMEELRRRRKEAEEEEADWSYLRRMLHGRLDIIRAELERRADGTSGGQQGLVEQLPTILADDRPGTFTAVSRVLVPSRVELGQRHAERTVADAPAAHISDLTDEELRGGAQGLVLEERVVSETRRKVQEVVDVLRNEVMRRYREGLADVASVLEDESESGS